MQAGIEPRLIALAHRMADEAGVIQRRYFRSGVAVEHKRDASPVTQADREVEQALRALIEAHCPDCGIVGEEFGIARPEAPFQWVIDPIDGTAAFIAGTPSFTSLIALASGGVPVLGVIDQPVTGERWLGIAGERTTLNGKPARATGCKDLAHATLSTTAMKYFKPEEAALFENVKNACARVAFGGDAYLYAGLASGRTDLAIEAGLKPYDFCALRPVIEGAGGVITDWQGRPLTLASDGRVIAAASPELHARALALLRVEGALE